MDSLKYDLLVGTGGIGSGIFFQLEDNRTLGRNESREGRLLDYRDFCKLHIISHYVAVLLGSRAEDPSSFQTVPVGRIGPDQTGSEMLEMMRQTGMDTRFVQTDKGAATLFSVCFQYPDSSGGNITTSASASSRVTAEDIRRAGSLFREHAGRGIALAAPEVPLEARAGLLKLAGEYAFLRCLAVNSAEIAHPLCQESIRRCDIFSLNRDEAETWVGDRLEQNDPGAFLGLLEKKILSVNPALRVCLTLGALGSYGYENGAWEFTPGAEVEPRSTAGAGDATMSGLIVGAAWGLPFILPQRASRERLSQAPLETALDFAALLASLSVVSADTINLEADVETLREHAGQLGIKLSRRIMDGLSR